MFSILIRMCNQGGHPLKGQHLTGTALGIKPFLFVDYNTRVIKGGVAMDTLGTVAKYYGFTYYVWLSQDVFILHKNGSIGGSFGDVKSFAPVQKTCFFL